MDFNKLIARVKAILLTPKTEWPVIANEPATVGDLYKNYIVVLAAIPAVATFIKVSLVGTNVWLAGRVRVDVGTGLTSMVVTYALTLASVYVVALIVDALAPTFNAQKDKTQALKTIAYAYTAGWVAGIAVIVPGIGGLIALAGGLYGIYLMYLGLPHTMKCPQEKAAGYTAVTIIATIVLYFIVTGIVSAMTGGALLGVGSTSYSGNTQFDADSPLGNLEEYGRNVEEATKKFEAAQKSGDQDAQNAALREMMGAALGGGAIEALAPDRLKSFLPETLMGMPRTDFSVERNDAMGMQISEGRATYSEEESGRSVHLEITDTGTAKNLLALAGFGMEGERESNGQYERVYRQNGRLIREQWDRAASSGEYAVVVADRFTVQLEGEADDIDDLRGALKDIDLRALEALKDEGKK